MLFRSKYFDNATRTLNTADISQEDLEQLKTGFEVFNEITRGEKSTDKTKAKRVAEFIESECDVTYNWNNMNLIKIELLLKVKSIMINGYAPGVSPISFNTSNSASRIIPRNCFDFIVLSWFDDMSINISLVI